MPIIITLALLLTAGTGVSFAAEKALPGDPLHAVKLGVNENVRSFFALGPLAQAEWQFELAERRLQEIETLAARGDLTKAVSLQSKSRIDTHTQRMRNLAFDLDDDDKLAMGAATEALFRAHSHILDSIKSEDEETQEALADLTSELEDDIDEAVDEREDSVDDIAESAPQEALELAQEEELDAKENIARAQNFLAANSALIDETVKELAESRIVLAQQFVVQGVEELAAGNTADALHLFQAAKITAKEARLVVDSALEITKEKTFVLKKKKSVSPVLDIARDRQRVRNRLAGDAIESITPLGNIVFEKRNDRTKLSVEVKDVNLPEGTLLEAFINGVSVGTFTLSELKTADLNLDSRNGNVIPAIVGGETVEVKAGDVTLVSGTVSSVSSLATLPQSSSASALVRSQDDSTRVRREEDRTEVRVGLSGNTLGDLTPSGHAKFETREDRVRLSVEVEDVGLASGTVLDIFVDGVKVGTVSVGSDGVRGADLSLDSRDGSTVPVIKGGEVVHVKDTFGNIVLAGAFPSKIGDATPAPPAIGDSVPAVSASNSGKGSVNSGSAGISSGGNGSSNSGSTAGNSGSGSSNSGSSAAGSSSGNSGSSASAGAGPNSGSSENGSSSGNGSNSESSSGSSSQSGASTNTGSGSSNGSDSGSSGSSSGSSESGSGSSNDSGSSGSSGSGSSGSSSSGSGSSSESGSSGSSGSGSSGSSEGGSSGSSGSHGDSGSGSGGSGSSGDSE